MLFDNNKFIHFRKTTSVQFASEYSWFADWLYAANSKGYINITSINAATSTATLSSKRQPLPVYNDVSIGETALNNCYFLDDIRVIYFRGIPYDSAQDYITSAEWSDSSVFSVDSESHTLYIPNPNRQEIEVNADNLSVAYIHQLDETGAYNPNERDSSITVYVKGESGKTFTIRQSMIEGQETDEKTAISYWGLKKYIDEKIQGGGSGSGSGPTAYWEEED